MRLNRPYSKGAGKIRPLKYGVAARHYSPGSNDGLYLKASLFQKSHFRPSHIFFPYGLTGWASVFISSWYPCLNKA